MVRLGSTKKRSSPEKGGSPLPPVSTERRVTNPLLETSPQRKAFSYLLRMLNTANEAKCKCDEEKQRLIPKLLKLLKQARREKNQLNQTHEVALQKAKKDLLASNKFWGTKVDELKKQHTLEIESFQNTIIEKDIESQRIWKQSERLVDELIAMEKILRTHEADKAKVNVQLNEIVAQHEEKIMALLQKQTDERNMSIHNQIEQYEQLMAKQAEQIKALEDRNAQALEDLSRRIIRATTIQLDLRSQKDNDEHQQQIQQLHNELSHIMASLQSKRIASRKNDDSGLFQSTPAESIGDCEIDLDDVQSSFPMISSRGEQTNESSVKSDTSRSEDITKQDASEISFIKSFQELQEKIEKGNEKFDELVKNLELMQQKLKQSIDLKQHQEVTQQIDNELKNANENIHILKQRVKVLEAKVCENLEEIAAKDEIHTEELSRATRQLEATKRDVLAEKIVNDQLREIIETLRCDNEFYKASIVKESIEHERIISSLRADHAAELIKEKRELEVYRREIAIEKCAKGQIQQILDALRKEVEEDQAISIKTTLEQERATLHLKEQHVLHTEQLFRAQAEIALCQHEMTMLQKDQKAKSKDIESRILDLTLDLKKERAKSRDLEDQISNLKNENEEEQARLRRDQILVRKGLENELAIMKEQWKKAEQEKITIKEDQATHVTSMEAANDAEVSVLKQYIKELESSIEESQSSLTRAQARQNALIQELERLQSQVQVLAPASIEPNGRPSKKGKHSDEGKENNILLSDPRKGSLATKHATTTSLYFSNPKENWEDSSSSSGIDELRRSLFVRTTADEKEVSIIHHQIVDSSTLERSIQPDNLTEQIEFAPIRGPNVQDSFELDSFEMEDLRERCCFLEHDRDELVRVTDQIIEYEKESHQLQLEAAVAAAKREATEQRRLWEQHTRRHIRGLYDALCSDCRHRIDSA